MISSKLLLVLWLVAAFSHVVVVQAGAMEERRIMPGGFQDADIQDARVVAAAGYSRQALVNENKYSFLSSSSISSGSMKVVVLNASQQVVAGMNYKLTLGLLDSNSGQCIGGFKCTVYDHFGDLSVTKWGDEVSCDEVMGMIKIREEQDATTEQDPET
jgi:hypothetical protein